MGDSGGLGIQRILYFQERRLEAKYQLCPRKQVRAKLPSTKNHFERRERNATIARWVLPKPSTDADAVSRPTQIVFLFLPAYDHILDATDQGFTTREQGAPPRLSAT